MKNIRFFFLMIVAFTLAVILSGCNTRGGSPTPTAAVYMPTRSVATLPPPTKEPVCTNIMVEDDEGIEDPMVVAAGLKFLKEWEVYNYSDCNWDEQYHLFFVSGSQMGAPDYVEIPHIPIGSKGKISIELTAPEEAGEYRSEWKLFGADNRFFGESLVVNVIVQ